jgi:hypothetical protein
VPGLFHLTKVVSIGVLLTTALYYTSSSSSILNEALSGVSTLKNDVPE